MYKKPILTQFIARRWHCANESLPTLRIDKRFVTDKTHFLQALIALPFCLNP